MNIPCGFAMLVKITAINCRYSHSCPAVFILREELEKNLPGCGTAISQFTINDPYYRMLLRLLDGRPDAVMFSVYLWNLRLAAALAADIRRVMPECAVVMGGPAAQQAAFAGVTVVQGEIEGVDPAFYRDLAAGSLRDFYDCVPARDFSSPYRLEDFSTLLANRSVYYESSRGCPFSCSYCLSSLSRGVRSRDVDAVMAEACEIGAHASGMIRFVDRTFNADSSRALELWKHLAGLDTGCVFHFEVAPDLFTEEQLAFLETVPAGRFHFEAGIQSVHERTLAAVNRRMDVERALENLARLAAMKNIHIHADLILGLPFEDAAGFAASFNRVWRSRPHHLQTGLLKVLPGTGIRERAAEFGMVFRHDPPYEILATRWLGQDELARLHLVGECFERFYNNRFFVSLWDWLRGRGEDGFAFFSGLYDAAGGMDFLEQAPTHERLCAALWDFFSGRADRNLARDLLLYDWLRCGMQHLPPCFSGTDLHAERRLAARLLPQNLEGLFDYRGRDRFLKRSLFFRPGPEALVFLGFDPENTQMLAVVEEVEDSVHRHRRGVGIRKQETGDRWRR